MPSPCHEISSLLHEILQDFEGLPRFESMEEFRASENARITAKKAPCDRLRFLKCETQFDELKCQEVSGPFNQPSKTKVKTKKKVKAKVTKKKEEPIRRALPELPAIKLPEEITAILSPYGQKTTIRDDEE